MARIVLNREETCITRKSIYYIFIFKVTKNLLLKKKFSGEHITHAT